MWHLTEGGMWVRHRNLSHHLLLLQVHLLIIYSSVAVQMMIYASLLKLLRRYNRSVVLLNILLIAIELVLSKDRIITGFRLDSYIFRVCL
jgi:hypothetical protein